MKRTNLQQLQEILQLNDNLLGYNVINNFVEDLMMNLFENDLYLEYIESESLFDKELFTDLSSTETSCYRTLNLTDKISIRLKFTASCDIVICAYDAPYVGNVEVIENIEFHIDYINIWLLGIKFENFKSEKINSLIMELLKESI